jgi:predicted nucleotidyltransferase component of viral defense system
MSNGLEHSIKDRIKAIAKVQNRTFNDLWKTLVLERFLARLSRSDKLDQFIFKGGFLLSKYISLGRETADIDFSLKVTTPLKESITTLIECIVTLPSEDGFSFKEISVEEMNHPHMNYPGYEVTALAILGETKTSIRIDLGIGDLVSPEKRSIELLALYGKPLFETDIALQVYPISYIFAEKLEAVVYRGGSNSRMKDFYDILRILNLAEFNLESSKTVIYSVFSHRKTQLPNKLLYDNRELENFARNWKRFLLSLQDKFSKKLPTEFVEVVKRINSILSKLNSNTLANKLF